MFRRSALLLCGVAVSMSALSGAAWAAHDDDDDDRGGSSAGASYASCPGARGEGRGESRGSRGDGRGASRGFDRDSDEDGDGRHRRGASSRYHEDLEEPDEMGDPRNRGYRLSCGGLGGAPGKNSASCGSSLLPAGAGVTSCAAPRARRGLDG